MCNKYTSKQTSMRSAYIFAGFFGIFSTSINKILLDAQIKEYNTKKSTTPNTYDESHQNTNSSPTAPQLPSLNHNYPLSLVPRSFRNLALTNITNLRPNYIQSPIHHLEHNNLKVTIDMNN